MAPGDSGQGPKQRYALDELIAIALRHPEVWERYTPPGDSAAAARAFREKVESREKQSRGADERARAILAATDTSMSWFEVASRRENHDPAIVRRLFDHAADQRAASAYLDAERVERAAIYLASQLPPSNERAALMGFGHKELANTYVMLSKYRQAMEALDEAERHYADVPCNDVDLAVVLLVRSVVYARLDRFDDALAAANESARVFERYGDTSRLLKARTARANVFMGVGRFEEATDIWRELAQLAHEQNDRKTEAQVAGNLGLCLHKLGRPAEAIEALARSVSIYKAFGETAQLPRIRRTLAHIHRERGEWETALRLLLNARDEFEASGSNISGCNITLDIAKMLLEKGDYSGAKQQLADLPRQFSDAGHHHGAIEAAAYLRHAVRSEQATIRTIERIQRFVDETRRYPQLKFTPPLDR